MSAPVVFSNLLVVGPGLIGASLALAAKRAGVVKHVIGYARQLATAQDAVAVGALDGVLPELSPEALSQACIGFDSQYIDAVFIAVPVGQLPNVLEQLAALFADQAHKPIMWDAGSTKGDTAATLLKQVAVTPWIKDKFVLCHPIAGREKHGPLAADETLFDGRSVIICSPDDDQFPASSSSEMVRSNAPQVEVVQRFWQALGAKVRVMSAPDHDQLFAAVSHLPHVLAFAYVAGLLAQSDGAAWMAEGGGGFRDFTRIAASSPEMWADIFVANRTELIRQLDGFETSLKQLRRLIEDHPPEQVARYLAPVASFRSSWGGM